MNALLKLTDLYQEEHRAYHNLEHIVSIFKYARKNKIELSKAQVMAIWFHDAIYDPQAQDNEEKSAQLAEELLGSDYPDLALIKSIILDTKKHEASTPESEIVLDLDLVILGLYFKEYGEYSRQIRQEYSFVPVETYVEKRREILTKMVERAKEGKLFYKIGELDSLNKTAIFNMEWEHRNLPVLLRMVAGPFN